MLFISAILFILPGGLDPEIIETGSIKYWLWIPKIIKSESVSDIGIVENYNYIPQDGTQPLIIQTIILAKGDKENIEIKIKQHFIANGFTINERHELSKGRQEVEFFVRPLKDNLWKVKISLIELR